MYQSLIIGIIRLFRPFFIRWLRDQVADTESQIDDKIAEIVIKALESI